MNIKTVKHDRINEVLYTYKHESGLKAFVISKKGYSKKYAAFATHFGSINNEFIAPGEKTPVKVPDGVAHFLEHKLFEQKNGNIMDKFSQLGSMPNAYTGFNQTVYLFSCTDKFKDNFRLLLNFVQNPYITDESVEKEKGIIAQEIRMYQDNPGWRVFFNLLGAFYKNNPVKIDIAGTVESINRINKDILYTCYNTFYHPSNMIITVVGDVNPESVFEEVKAGIKKTESASGIKRIFAEEPDSINKNYVEQNLAVSIPLFQMGFKDSKWNLQGMERLKREISIKILLEMIMGRSSELYTRLYNEGLINRTFEFDYTSEENYAFSLFGGESPNPEKVKEIICDKISEIHKDGLNRDSFERIRKALYGRFIRQFNFVERISHAFISAHFKNINMFDYLDAYDKIIFEYAEGLFREHFNLDNLAMSVIRPL
jgi:predicted Zn-dependent peptidase